MVYFFLSLVILGVGVTALGVLDVIGFVMMGELTSNLWYILLLVLLALLTNASWRNYRQLWSRRQIAPRRRQLKRILRAWPKEALLYHAAECLLFIRHQGKAFRVINVYTVGRIRVEYFTAAEQEALLEPGQLGDIVTESFTPIAEVVRHRTYVQRAYHDLEGEMQLRDPPGAPRPKLSLRELWKLQDIGVMQATTAELDELLQQLSECRPLVIDESM